MLKYLILLTFATLSTQYQQDDGDRFSFIVAIQNISKTICSGIIIHEKFILTTAYCIMEHYWPYFVEFSNRRSSRRNIIPVIAIRISPSFNSITRENDLAILRLARKLPISNFYDNNVKKIALDENGWFNNCFAIYMCQNYYYKIECARWSTEIFRPINLNYNDFVVDVPFNIFGNERIQFLYGSPLICDGRLVGLLSSKEKSKITNTKTLGIFAKTTVHYDWIKSLVRDLNNWDKGTVSPVMDCERSATIALAKHGFKYLTLLVIIIITIELSLKIFNL